MAFQPVEGSANFPAQEETILKFWKERGVYEKSLAQREGGPEFVFYEGPPTANGLPHPGHCLTRAIKDLFPRYRTMRGYHCTRKAGWDTHGLPVEVEVCKELGIHSKEEIEAYGVEPFIHKCQQSVWRYMREWERLTERLGFWVNLEEAYVTYHQSYVESVWWSLKQLFDRGLLYQGHKIVWWWAQGGTALSAGEVGQGYREVADPSVYVKFPILNDDGQRADTSLLVWTTTPWTLPSNQFAAVNPNLDYAAVIDVDEEKGRADQYVVALSLVESLSAKLKRKLVTTAIVKGSELIGRRYLPPFEEFFQAHAKDVGRLRIGVQQVHAWRVVGANFVTTDSGTGVVHIAPAFGEADFEVLKEEQKRFGIGPGLINAVAPDGEFNEYGPEYCRGRWVKDCDKDIIRDLKQRGLLLHQEQYVHEYPFCWRAEEDPLIQYPRHSWFIRTTAFKDELLANNNAINWLPEHIKTGRMGKFLESNVDWALSRERYWGTPLPIWQCEETGYQETVGSYDELLAKPGLKGTQVWQEAKAAHPELPNDLCVHKPYIDAMTYDSPKSKGARMRRVPDVIDCWYDSGAMPFAQWGYCGESESQAAEQFRQQFPADFISEALDQTRGWFYSQLAISTLLFSPLSPPPPGRGWGPGGGGDSENATDHGQLSTDNSAIRNYPYPHPFKNCIVLGLMLGEDGQKMAKSKRNYREPKEIFDKYGADALRWYFFATQPPWTTIRYSEQAIKESIPEFLLRLWNVYSFFVIYANIDEFEPGEEVGGQGSEVRGQVSEVGDLSPAALAAAKFYRPVKDRSELDRWILSELHRTAAGVTNAMDAYDCYGACEHLTAFVDALSNWYVRRSRDRFWMSDKRAAEKLDAYWTLYECLVTTARLVAPFVPFVAETIWQNLAGSAFGERAAESVHLCDYPTGDPAASDLLLSDRMALMREIVSLGRNARMTANLKVRQPIAKVDVVLTQDAHEAWLNEHVSLIKEELNAKDVAITVIIPPHVHFVVLPNLKHLGPRLGKRLPRFKEWLANEGESAGDLLNELEHHGTLAVLIGDGLGPVHVTKDDFIVRLEAEPGWSAAKGPTAVVVLDTELRPDLIAEGLARDVVRLIQDRRKEIGCAYTDRILVGIVSQSEELLAAVRAFSAYIQQETLADDIRFGPIEGADPVTREAGGHKFELYVKVVT